MDVCMTKDSRVVVVHDPNLKRICGVDKFVSEFNYDELPEIQSHFPLHFSDRICDTTKEKDRKIPLFDDVCRELKDTCINMEIKSRDPNIGVECQKIISKYNMQKKVVWGHFRHPLMKELRELDPSIACFASDLEMIVAYLAYFLGLLSFISLSCDQLGIPIYNKSFQDFLDVMKVKPWKAFLTKVIIKAINLLCGPMYIHLRKRGIEPTVWIQNEESDIEYAFSYEGVCGIMTDQPFKFVEYAKTEIIN